MKNREKYIKAILNYQGESFCNDFIQPTILEPLGKVCSNITCLQCEMICCCWLEEEYVEFRPIDWFKVVIDTPILVCDKEGKKDDKWYKRYFASYEDGIVYAFADGKTSWTTDTVCEWEFAKLAEKDGVE